jgi:intein/homing endonuclease
MAWTEGNQKRRKHFLNINQEILDAKGFLEEREAKVMLYKFLKENPSFTCELLTGIKLFPFQHMAIKSMMLTDYFLGVWCLEKNEYVLTSEGFKKIKDINIGDEVRSRKGLNKVLDKWENPNQLGLEIILKSGDSFKAKKGHKVLTYNAGQFDFKKIEDLKIGDQVPVKLGTNIWGDNDILKNSGYKNNAHLFYLLGYVLGDGYVSKDGYGMHYCSEHIEVHETILKFIQDNNLKSYARQRSSNLNFYEYAIFNREFIKWIESIGWDISLKSANKIICDQLLTASKKEICALIGGLFDADGYASYQEGGSKIGLKNTSLQLLRQVKMLLNNLGVESCVRLSGENKGVKYYDLVLSNDFNSLKTFQTEIDFIVSHKKNNLAKSLERSKTRNYQNKLVPELPSLLKTDGPFEKVVGKKGSWANSFSQNEFDKLKNLSHKNQAIINSIKEEGVVFSPVKFINECEVESIDITVDNEECYIGNGIVHHNSRGQSKSFTTGLFAALDAVLHQGVHIGIISKSFRQSRMIFSKIEDIMKTPKASMFAEAVTRVSKNNDQWVMEIGRSKITALPLGDGEKLRGFRFQRMIIDEFLLMPERIFNEVILPFLSVVENPTERQEIYNLETQLIEAGKMQEEDRTQWPNNKIIGLSSASYKFEYLYKLYQQYEHLILNPEKSDVAHRVIMHLSYDCAPTQLYDQSLIQQAKSTLSQSQFDREFGSIFTDDSSGYFKVSKMAACTIEDGQGQCVEVAGEPNDEYILSFDPSWSESESSDDFGMHVIKINKEKRTGTVVHSYAISGTRLKDHIFYFYYLLTSFNIVCVVGDYNGGVQFLNACNESDLFKSNDLKIDCFDADFDDVQNYDASLREARNQYNLSSKKICHLRRPTSQWIRFANESLQSSFDHKKIWFACSAVNDDYQRQRGKSIPIDQIRFLRVADADEKNTAAKMIDFIEHQKDMIDLTKAECALIQVSTTSQGTQSFDLPSNLKRQNGADKARRDSYSALVLGNWMVQTYFDMMNFKADDTKATFAPFFV